MARGTWKDFNDKWGFREGEMLTGEDFEARARLVVALNNDPRVVAANVRFCEFDRPGMHNPCLIVAFDNPGKLTDEQLLVKWHAGEITKADFGQHSGEGLASELDLEEITAAAYED